MRCLSWAPSCSWASAGARSRPLPCCSVPSRLPCPDCPSVGEAGRRPPGVIRHWDPARVTGQLSGSPAAPQPGAGGHRASTRGAQGAGAAGGWPPSDDAGAALAHPRDSGRSRSHTSPSLQRLLCRSRTGREPLLAFPGRQGSKIYWALMRGLRPLFLLGLRV